MITKLVSSLWFRATISIAVLAYIVGRLDWRDAVNAVFTIDVRFLIAAFIVDTAARATMISRWLLLLRSTGAVVNTWAAARIFFISSFIGIALPTGGTDVTRAYALARHTTESHVALASVVVDRLLGVSALIVLVLVGLSLGSVETLFADRTLIVGLSVATAGGLTLALWADLSTRLLLPVSLQTSRLGTWLLRTADGIAHYRKRPLVLVAVLGQSVLVQGLRIFEIFLLGSGLGLGVNLTYYLIFMPVGLLAFMLPISVAGVGLPQGVIVSLFQPAGVPDTLSFALSTLIVLLGIVGTLPGLYLHLRAKKGLE